MYGPIGFFTLREPMTDSILIATGTGIAPMRGICPMAVSANGPDRSQGKQIWLVYGTRHESELYYRDEFEALAARHRQFHYLPTLSRATESWTGSARIRAGTRSTDYRGAGCAAWIAVAAPPLDASIPAAELRFDLYAYVCGLSKMITSVRERLKGLGWHRKQIIFERYD